ncbi:hypothetical protein CYMTET_6280 [Cymbomonas tetramitiformis]|uniref:Uncharacterized protein n=1 Tax=Cymbomonas tetramitiformis TaxID=36881 RepID=A0AAE0GXT5_9CHLO|nr:hypothetical protein CYMTET_6280 [Cymbomonas tetramitiformis]
MAPRYAHRPQAASTSKSFAPVENVSLSSAHPGSNSGEHGFGASVQTWKSNRSAISGGDIMEVTLDCVYQSGGADIQIWLPPPTMLALGIGARDTVLLTVLRSPHSCTSSKPGTPGTGKRAATRAAVPRNASSSPSTPQAAAMSSGGAVEPICLSNLCGNEYSMLLGPRTAAECEDPGVRAGEYVAAAAAWPTPKLPQHVVQISQGLYDTLGRPPLGSLLGLVPTTSTPFPAATTTDSASCTTTPTSTPTRPPPSGASGAKAVRTPTNNSSAAAPVRRVPITMDDCQELQLVVCTEPVSVGSLLAGSAPHRHAPMGLQGFQAHTKDADLGGKLDNDHARALLFQWQLEPRGVARALATTTQASVGALVDEPQGVASNSPDAACTTYGPGRPLWTIGWRFLGVWMASMPDWVMVIGGLTE